MRAYKQKISFFLLIFSFVFSGCGMDADEKLAEVILKAQMQMSEGLCSEALTTLSGYSSDTNARFIITKASAYACLGGLRSGAEFISTDIPNTATPSPFGGTAKYTTSDDMTSTTESKYLSMQSAVDLLIYAGGLSEASNPTVALRRAAFSTKDSLDIHSQLMYFMLIQLGRYYHFYGNSSSTGVKGSGTGAYSNSCFINYDNIASDGTPDINSILSLGGGACTASTDQGHDDIGTTGSLDHSIMCQGVILMNHLFAVIPEVLSGFAGDDLTAISSFSTLLTTLKSVMVTYRASTSTVNGVLSQSLCESQNSASQDDIQFYFASLIEPMFQ